MQCEKKITQREKEILHLNRNIHGHREKKKSRNRYPASITQAIYPASIKQVMVRSYHANETPNLSSKWDLASTMQVRSHIYHESEIPHLPCKWDLASTMKVRSQPLQHKHLYKHTNHVHFPNEPLTNNIVNKQYNILKKQNNIVNK